MANVKISGKDYRPVADRLIEAHGEKARPAGITSVSTEYMDLGADRSAIRATVLFEDGRSFTGISQVFWDAKSGADKTNPIECSETSALGRALAAAGYLGSADGIAGAEEMQRASNRYAPQKKRAPQPAATAEADIDAGLAEGEASIDSLFQQLRATLHEYTEPLPREVAKMWLDATTKAKRDGNVQWFQESAAAVRKLLADIQQAGAPSGPFIPESLDDVVVQTAKLAAWKQSQQKATA